MNPIVSILTHPGGAHKDEFLACSVLLAVHQVPIFRHNPQATDLANPQVLVVDVGHDHNPELGNFDHHQFPRDSKPTCSLSLVLQHLGVYEDAKQFCEWLEPAEWFDCRGPMDTAKWLGVERDLLARLNSPIDVTLLRRFAMATRISQGEPLWEVMRMVGEDLLGYLNSLRAKLDLIQEIASVWHLDLGGREGKVVFLPRTEPMPDEPSAGMERFVESQSWSGEVVGLVYPDRRGTGYGLSRYRDNPRLDFTLIADCEEVHFAHARGFLAKTSTTEIERLKELMVAAGVRHEVI